MMMRGEGKGKEGLYKVFEEDSFYEQIAYCALLFVPLGKRVDLHLGSAQIKVLVEMLSRPFNLGHVSAVLFVASFWSDYFSFCSVSNRDRSTFLFTVFIYLFYL